MRRTTSGGAIGEDDEWRSRAGGWRLEVRGMVVVWVGNEAPLDLSLMVLRLQVVSSFDDDKLCYAPPSVPPHLSMICCRCLLILL